MKSTFVSGPLNCIRIEGTINSIKKVLYIFMDKHLNVQHQTQCEDIFAPDIKTYFINTFNNIKNKNKTYDFFFENKSINIIQNSQ